MVDDTSLKERLTRAAEAAAPAPRLPEVARRARILRWRRAGGAAVVAAIVAAAIVVPLSRLAGLRDDHSRIGPFDDRVGAIGFEPADGWSLAASDPASPEWPPTVWVTNGRFADEDLEGATEQGGVTRFRIGPEATSKRLPADGILITADVLYVSKNPLPPSDTFAPMELPLPLPSTPPATAWEGFRPGHSLHSVVGEVNGRWISVRIEYGSEHPDGPMLAAAQEELDRLFVEPAPPPMADIDQFGLSMAVPGGWHGRLFAWTSGPPTLELSTLPLEEPSGDPAIPNHDLLGELDASVVLSENDAIDLGYEQIPLPIEVRAVDRCDGCEVLDDGSSVPDGHALYHRSFEIAGRSFELYVEFGSADPPTYVWHSVNDALGEIVIAGAPSIASPIDRPILPVVPDGWSVQEDPLPALIDPRILVAAGSWDFPRPPLIACGRQPALTAMPASAAFFWIVGYPLPPAPSEPTGRLDEAVPWPSRFSLDLPHRHSDFECAAGTDDVREYLFRGTDRVVQVQIGIGPDAGGQVKAQLEEVLSGFEA